MGCDIHLFAEKKDGEKWRMITSEFQSWNGTTDERMNVGRDYELFAFLADVRNSYGILPLAEPRGVPVDASLRYRANVEDYGEDGHSHSYFTLEELKNIPKEKIEQVFDDGQQIIEKDEKGNITATAAWSSAPTLGPVGKRKLFSLWGKNKIDQIIKEVDEAVKCEDNLKDSDVRVVFFFDN